LLATFVTYREFDTIRAVAHKMLYSSPIVKPTGDLKNMVQLLTLSISILFVGSTLGSSWIELLEER